MAKVISDHIVCVKQKTGEEKPAPCWQIRVWIQKGMFSLETEKGNPVGWDFKDHRAGVSEYEAWEAERKRRIMMKRSAAAPVKRDEGIAEAQFHPQTAPKAPEAFDEVPETGVPVMDPGIAEKEPLSKPKDVI